ncbi:hypothetical protein CYMTET_56475 [Cymbomonas tetramitiformis]|uniref:Uncharacterized protein n=1 Tax=Cymbomonas tetramitiformis TaxID=36881 RepID=A0AAE0EMI6_9CHLO|nr:hypothetical protein CYMTET_56475 [Cymbomonas tetramitiformis]
MSKLCTLFIAAAVCAAGTMVDARLDSGLQQWNSFSSAGDQGRPWFCHGLNCPKFELKRAAVESIYEMLHQYIDGENEANQKMDMTAPVAVAIQPGQGPSDKAKVTVQFFGNNQEADLPKPKNDRLSVKDYDASTFYVLSYSEQNDAVTIKYHARRLNRALQADNMSFDESYVITAFYDKYVGAHHLLLQC